MKRNWKTTVCAVVAACGGGMAGLDDPLLRVIGQILAFVGTALTGYFAKDFNVTGA